MDDLAAELVATAEPAETGRQGQGGGDGGRAGRGAGQHSLARARRDRGGAHREDRL